MATPKKSKISNKQKLPSPIVPNNESTSSTADATPTPISLVKSPKAVKPLKSNPSTVNPKKNVRGDLGVSNLDNPELIRKPAKTQEEKQEYYRTWKPTERETAEQLYGRTFETPADLQEFATNRLNEEFSGPSKTNQENDWKYRDEKLDALRDNSYESAANVINNPKFNIPQNVRDMFTNLGKKNWISTGSARLAANLRFNTQMDVRHIAQLLEHATGESFTKTGTNQITTEGVGKVLDKFLSARNTDLYQFIKTVEALPSSHHTAKNAIKASLAMMGMYEEAKYALSLGENVSGKKWYKDMVEAHDKGLAHLISNHTDFAPIAHVFGKVDNDGNWEKNADQDHNMVLFKGFLAPTSNGQDPMANGFSAFNMLRAGAIEAQRDMRSGGLNRQIEMFDIINHMPKTQAGFDGTRTDLRTYVKNDIKKNPNLTYDDIVSKWNAKGYINDNTGRPFTKEDVERAIANKTPLNGHTIDPKTNERSPLATKWLLNAGGVDSMVDFYKKFITGELNNDLANVGLGHLAVGNLVAENGAKLDLTTPQGRQDAVNKLSTFLTSEFDADQIKSLKDISAFHAPDLGNSENQTATLGKLPGSWIMGPKIGLFFQNMNNNHKWVTADMWVMRTYGRLMGSLFDKDGSIIEAPNTAKNEIERGALQHSFEKVSEALGLNPAELQAVLWYHEQQLWKSLGNKSESYSYEDFINSLGDAHAQEGKYTPLYKTAKTISQQDAEGETSTQPIENLRGMQHTWGESLPPFHDKRFSESVEQSIKELNGAKYIDPKKHPNSYKLKQDIGEVLSKLHLSKSGKPIKYAQFTPVNGGMQSAPVSDRTNVPFGNAVAKVNTGKNIAHAQLNDQVAQKAGVRTTSSTAIGDWPNGSEQSTMHTADSMTEPERMRYLAAWHGLASQKKSVLVFHPNPKGPDSLYHINHPETDLGKLREQLNQFNLQYKTLVPGAKGTKVILFDPAKSNRSAIDQFATKNNLEVVENTGQGEILGHNGDWNSAGALPKSRQAYNNIIAQYEQNQNSTRSSSNPSGASSTGKQGSAGETKKQLQRAGRAIKFDKARRILEGFLRAHNTPNKELPHVGDLLANDLQNIKPEHITKYQQLVPGAKWNEIENAVTSLKSDPTLYEDMTSEANRREMYCKEHARTVLHSSGLQKLLDSLVVQKAIPEHAQHLIPDAKDGDYFALEAISAELNHGIPALKAFAKAAEREYNKAGKAWDKMRGGVQKFSKPHHSKSQHRASGHGIINRGLTYKPGQFAPQGDGVARFEKGCSKMNAIYKTINKFRGS